MLSLFIAGCIYSLSHIFLSFYIPFARSFMPSGIRDHLANMGEHSLKKFTPTMGGIVFIIPLIAFVLFYSHSIKAHFIIIATLSSLLVGFYDDYRKIKYKNGISAQLKFFLQATGSLIASTYWYTFDTITPSTIECGFCSLQLGIFYIAWAAFVIMAASHAVNLTDGLDGLATSHAIIVLLFFSFVTAIKQMGMISELNNYALYMIASCAAFFVYNRYPAKIFMGDVGALGLGAFIGSLFLMARIECTLVFLGWFFVCETLSVIIQCFWWKIYRKRLFLCAPIHHHFEKKGYHEKKIVEVSSIISMILGIIFSIIFYYFQNNMQ